jgi:hypothetical protein
MLALDEHQVRSTGLLWRLLRHGEAGVGARSIRAPGGRPTRQHGGGGVRARIAKKAVVWLVPPFMRPWTRADRSAGMPPE